MRQRRPSRIGGRLLGGAAAVTAKTRASTGTHPTAGAAMHRTPLAAAVQRVQWCCPPLVAPRRGRRMRDHRQAATATKQTTTRRVRRTSRRRASRGMAAGHFRPLGWGLSAVAMGCINTSSRISIRAIGRTRQRSPPCATAGTIRAARERASASAAAAAEGARPPPPHECMGETRAATAAAAAEVCVPATCRTPCTVAALPMSLAAGTAGCPHGRLSRTVGSAMKQHSCNLAPLYQKLPQCAENLRMRAAGLYACVAA